MALSISKKGLELIKKFEGCVLKAYRCPAGAWTIGYGHTSGVKSGMVITEAQAEEFLKADCKWAEKAVNEWDKRYNWNQNQFDALVSFTFNCGAGNLKTLLASGNRTIAEISEKILLYNKANGKTLEGLVRRRKEEKALFDAKVKSSASAAKPAVKTAKKIDVDGRWGKETTKRAQEVFHTVADGIISNQLAAYRSYFPGILESTIKWETVKKGGSALIKAMQVHVGVEDDGYLGQDTARAWQRYLGTPVDGRFDNPSSFIKAFQNWLNAQ